MINFNITAIHSATEKMLMDTAVHLRYIQVHEHCTWQEAKGAFITVNNLIVSIHVNTAGVIVGNFL